jgi:hypothetical protein
LLIAGIIIVAKGAFKKPLSYPANKCFVSIMPWRKFQRSKIKCFLYAPDTDRARGDLVADLRPVVRFCHPSRYSLPVLA